MRHEFLQTFLLSKVGSSYCHLRGRPFGGPEKISDTNFLFLAEAFLNFGYFIYETS